MKTDNEKEIAKQRDSGIRRALNTPPKKNKELVGSTERAQDTKITRFYKKKKPQ